MNGASAVGEKQVFGSEGMVAGMGCQTFAFMRWRIWFLSLIMPQIVIGAIF